MNDLRQVTLCIALLFTISATRAENRVMKLNDCKIAEHPLHESPSEDIIKMITRGKPEAYSDISERMVECYGSPFVDAAGYAFATHRPLRLSPDHIWLVITQGFAAHVNNHPEELRTLFVSHEGKVVLDVRRDDFKKGKKDNPWEEVFPEFSKQIGTHIGQDAQQLITARFSTTSPAEQAAFEITLMDAVKQYFTYSVTTFCGIPEIILEGTTADWKSLRERTQKLAQYDLQWWTDELDPILAQFVEASEGRVNLEFWNSFYKQRRESGGPYINGWILKLFPYLRGSDNLPSRRNPMLTTNPPEHSFICSDDFPRGMSSVPFVWNYFDTEYDMMFLAGFLGISQDEDSKTLEPEIGWVVYELPKESFWAKLFGQD